MKRYKNLTGFTIVELLIVIVVIAILAAISIVAYNGIQNRGNIASINASLSQLNKTVQAYHAIKGSYPDTTNAWVSQHSGNLDTFIPGLVPEVTSSLPRALEWSGSPRFYYRSTGIDYKLLYLYPSTQTIPDSAASSPEVQRMLDPVRPTRGWGFWTSGGAGY
jgi:prepilin-type N-terminal cleavage/methylation domain-containing protein